MRNLAVSSLDATLNPLSLMHQEQHHHRKIYRIKILVLGNTNVGKSSIIFQYANKQKPQYQKPTIGLDFAMKTLLTEDIECHLQIWDTAGQKQFGVLPMNIYRGILGVLLVCDLTDKKSLDDLRKYWDEIVDIGETKKQVMLIANKSDLDREQIKIMNNDLMNFAKPRNLFFTTVSAFNEKEINDVFKRLVANILKNIEDGIIDEQHVIVKDGGSNKLNKIVSFQDRRRYNRCC